MRQSYTKSETSGQATDSFEDSARQLGDLISRHPEWIYSFEQGRESGPLRRSDCEFRAEASKLIFTCWGDFGSRVWRVNSWNWTGTKLDLDVAQKFTGHAGKLELVPRATAAVTDAAISEARFERCVAIGGLVLDRVEGAKIERLKLSPGTRPGKPGRYARIILRDRFERIAVTAVVAETKTSVVDSYVSNAIVWFLRVRERIRGLRLGSLFLITSELESAAIRRRVSLLSEDLRNSIVIWEIDECWKQLTPIDGPELSAFLIEEQPQLKCPSRRVPGPLAAAIVEMAPDSIDCVWSRHGETLRFHGLPFARVRTVMETEGVWFGVDRMHRKRLGPDTERDWDAMFSDLALNRQKRQPDHRNNLYRALPEAWLESILRRDITRLDPGLVIAPIHAQFRTGPAGRAASRPIDLLALREDGRLVVIELKVSEDPTLTLQGAEYWLRVEAHRRQGNIERAALFGDRQIVDEAPLVYLVGPTLRFHRSFSLLAKCIRPEIEIYRFDINENWRGGVRVMRRGRAN